MVTVAMLAIAAIAGLAIGVMIGDRDHSRPPMAGRDGGFRGVPVNVDAVTARATNAHRLLDELQGRFAPKKKGAAPGGGGA